MYQHSNIHSQSIVPALTADQSELRYPHGPWNSEDNIPFEAQLYEPPSVRYTTPYGASTTHVTVLAKYAGHAGHVRQSSADVRQRALTLPDILSSRIQHLQVIN